MSELTKEQLAEAQKLGHDHGCLIEIDCTQEHGDAFSLTTESLAMMIANIRTQAINDTLHAVRKCEKRSGTCFMVHSILNKRHPDVCDAKNCKSIREMKVPT